MAQINEVYKYLEENYEPNEPIFLSDLNIPNMKPSSLRPQLKKLTEEGRIKRFDIGIYYIPKKSIFRFGSAVSIYDVIKKKYLTDNKGHIDVKAEVDPMVGFCLFYFDTDRLLWYYFFAEVEK